MGTQWSMVAAAWKVKGEHKGDRALQTRCREMQLPPVIGNEMAKDRAESHRSAGGLGLHGGGLLRRHRGLRLRGVWLGWGGAGRSAQRRAGEGTGHGDGG